MTDRIDIAAELVHETDNAFLLNDGRTDGKGKPVNVWVPKSLCEETAPGIYLMPEWLATDKEFI